MEDILPRFKGAIILSLLIAFVLTILPLRDNWIILRPEWIALTLIHWALVTPSKTSLMVAWIAGLLVDVLYGSIIGQHALGFVIILIMSLRMRSRLLIDSTIQQLFLVFLVLGTYLLINLWILGITGSAPAGWDYWVTVITSLIIWPFYHYYLSFFHVIKKPFE